MAGARLAWKPATVGGPRGALGPQERARCMSASMSGRSRCQAGRLAGAVARQLGGIPCPEGGRVEGDALSQIVGMVEPPVADPGILLQGMEEPLDAPAQQRLGALKVGLALGAEQHPV